MQTDHLLRHICSIETIYAVRSYDTFLHLFDSLHQRSCLHKSTSRPLSDNVVFLFENTHSLYMILVKFFNYEVHHWGAIFVAFHMKVKVIIAEIIKLKATLMH